MERKKGWKEKRMKKVKIKFMESLIYEKGNGLKDKR